MANEFQRTKMTAMFQAFDADANGHLDQHDFRALADRWHAVPRVAADPELAVRVERLMLGWWDLLSAAADANGDGRVDLDELLAMVDRLPEFRDTVTATADTVFDAVDENGDGRISRTEHRHLVDVWHGRPTETADVFDRLDQDGDGYLSRPEFRELWAQFWISADPAEPGNLLCGPLPV
ncbi:EF-hand domain-containing protein [Streptomyces sp. TLI_171]|uniref:EF-hand domain-containing protein n=1 Tax=Streptomyces sp. TLI_171 TaxID=1938859 RepID=UPI000C1763A5|nr:EF-hand domain-containing protein [Streptomyces sp. TLI_171]RKE22987.1 Ca2+-binding EF-hand superfamily protein [Streptomyces sp. TLI_171]